MARILTGIQSTGTPHLGNIIGAILPAIENSKDKNNDSFLFIADLHSLTQIKDAKVLKNNTYSVAAAWLAFGLDPNESVFYRQSDVPECTELAWYLNCFFPFQRLKLAHSFKDKADRLEDVNAGLFIYPMLMAADILLYDANLVPVGKDQLQHLEMARDVASRINHKYKNVFIVPEPLTTKDSMLIPGTDGEKMSKSKNNTIDIFQANASIKKIVNKQIVTDTIPLEDPKDPYISTVYKLYSVIADEDSTTQMAKKLQAGGYGWGHAKKELISAIETKFDKPREKFNYYMSHKEELDLILESGAAKARKVAQATLRRVRNQIGY
ncbi:MAG: tryptophan--tRNA ligase [Flavobacteriales bacterium]|jgi:tryptophanyl-tRNA synthetase|nr:tryptophan--tRNA ligase [Flavobacteriales bacterium]